MKNTIGKSSDKWEQHAIDFYMKDQSEERLVENLLLDKIFDDFAATLHKLYEENTLWNGEKYCPLFTNLLSNKEASNKAEKNICKAMIEKYPNLLNQVLTQLKKIELEMPSPQYKTILLGRIAPLLLMAMEINHPIMMQMRVEMKDQFIKEETDPVNDTTMDDGYSNLPELIPKHEADKSDDEIPSLMEPARKTNNAEEMSVLEQIEMWHSE